MIDGHFRFERDRLPGPPHRGPRILGKKQLRHALAGPTVPVVGGIEQPRAASYFSRARSRSPLISRQNPIEYSARPSPGLRAAAFW